MYEVTTHQNRHGQEVVTAFSLCTDPTCQASREVTAVANTVSQMGDGPFSRVALVETRSLVAVTDDNQADDSVYSCDQCGEPAILSEKPRREVPSQGYAHPQSRAWDQAKAARGA